MKFGYSQVWKTHMKVNVGLRLGSAKWSKSDKILKI
jgi:hypothetical protein